MATTPVTFLAISLLAVTFGWAPAEPNESVSDKPILPSDEGRASGYEYHVRVSPNDLEDLRAGRVDSLSSHLPNEVGPIERVRITFGEGPAPRELTAADRKARASENEGPRRYVVAKPATPEWGPAPKRHVAYQNPNQTTLEQGFEEAARSLGVEAQQAEEWVRRQTQNMTDSAVDSGVQLAQAYVGPPPADGGNPDGSRPPQNGPSTSGALSNNYGTNQTVTPPAPTGAANNGQLNYNGASPTYNTGATPSYNTNPYGAQNSNATGSTQLALPPPPGAPAPVPRSNTNGTNNGFETNPYAPNNSQGPSLATPRSTPVLESFANDSNNSYGPTGQGNVTPVRQPPAYSSSPTRNGVGGQQYGPNYPREDVWRPTGGGETGYASQKSPTEFPSRQPNDLPPLVDNRNRGASAQTSYTNYDRDRQSDTSTRGNSWLNPRGEGADDSSRERGFAGLDDGEQQKTLVVAEPSYFETLVIVILCAVTFFTWTSYLEIRNKYRAALRGAPTAGGLAA